MDDLIGKSMRLRKPKYLNVQLRPVVYDYLSDHASALHCSVSVLVRGIIEDFYDKKSSPEGGDPE